jgi:hypothetical protein
MKRGKLVKNVEPQNKSTVNLLVARKLIMERKLVFFSLWTFPMYVICYFSYVRSKYPPQYFLLKHTQFTFVFRVKDQVSYRNNTPTGKNLLQTCLCLGIIRCNIAVLCSSYAATQPSISLLPLPLLHNRRLENFFCES